MWNNLVYLRAILAGFFTVVVPWAVENNLVYLLAYDCDSDLINHQMYSVNKQVYFGFDNNLVIFLLGNIKINLPWII